MYVFFYCNLIYGLKKKPTYQIAMKKYIPEDYLQNNFYKRGHPKMLANK